MKYLLLLLFSILFIGCTNNKSNNTPSVPAPGEETEIEKNDNDILDPDSEENEIQTALPVDLDYGVSLESFSERQMIESPLILKGKAPRNWFFEGVIPVNLLTLENEIIVESYGSGAWLEPLEGFDKINGEDLIEFTSTIEFETPNSDMGKLRISEDATGSQETGQEPKMVETIILWPAAE